MKSVKFAVAVTICAFSLSAQAGPTVISHTEKQAIATKFDLTKMAVKLYDQKMREFRILLKLGTKKFSKIVNEVVLQAQFEEAKRGGLESLAGFCEQNADKGTFSDEKFSECVAAFWAFNSTFTVDDPDSVSVGSAIDQARKEQLLMRQYLNAKDQETKTRIMCQMPDTNMDLHQECWGLMKEDIGVGQDDAAVLQDVGSDR